MNATSIVTRRVLATAGSFLLLVGCSSEPVRYDLHGKVLYNGKPVPVGRIVFDPVAAKGKGGPQGFARIKDGIYDTRTGGKGTVGGQQVVRIDGFDGTKIDDDSPQGSPLFPGYEQNVDLPKQDTELDFVVPLAEPSPSVDPSSDHLLSPEDGDSNAAEITK